MNYDVFINSKYEWAKKRQIVMVSWLHIPEFGLECRKNIMRISNEFEYHYIL